jgi:YD repeat-containing protein
LIDANQYFDANGRPTRVDEFGDNGHRLHSYNYTSTGQITGEVWYDSGQSGFYLNFTFLTDWF